LLKQLGQLEHRERNIRMLIIRRMNLMKRRKKMERKLKKISYQTGLNPWRNSMTWD
jgi:hypothetical protein